MQGWYDGSVLKNSSKNQSCILLLHHSYDVFLQDTAQHGKSTDSAFFHQNGEREMEKNILYIYKHNWEDVYFICIYMPFA